MPNFDEPLPIYDAQGRNQIIEYFEENNVPGNVVTTVISYTAVSDLKLERIMGFGQVDAWWELYIDTVKKVRKVSNPQEPDIDWIFLPTPIPIASGQIVTVKFEHKVAKLLNFNATLFAKTEDYRYG